MCVRGRVLTRAVTPSPRLLNQDCYAGLIIIFWWPNTLGLTRLPSGKLKIADKTFKYSKFCSILSAPDWREQYTSTIAYNSYQSKRHVDSSNSEQSMMLGLGSYRIYGNADCKKLLAVCPWLTTGASARLTAKNR